MTPLEQHISALMVAEHAFAPATPGFVGATVELTTALGSVSVTAESVAALGLVDAELADAPDLADANAQHGTSLGSADANGEPAATPGFPDANAQHATAPGSADTNAQHATSLGSTNADGEPATVPGFPDTTAQAPGFADTTAGFVSALHGRVALRHGFLIRRANGQAVVSGPPSPGLEASIARMSDDLDAVRARLGAPAPGGVQARLGTPAPGGVLARLGAFAPGGVRVALEAGLEGGGPLGLNRRWALANMLAPVLAAAFANSPSADGWRSIRQARHSDLPVLRAIRDPRRAWAAYVLEQPGLARPGPAELDRHAGALRPPVAARGHLEIDVADQQPGDGWRVVVAVTAVLMDDPRAAAAAEQITAPLAAEPDLWARASRDALSDPVLATAARACFVEAYGTLARHGVTRDLRDQVAEFTERYVMRGRCPADDQLDAGVRPVPR